MELSEYKYFIVLDEIRYSCVDEILDLTEYLNSIKFKVFKVDEVTGSVWGKKSDIVMEVTNIRSGVYDQFNAASGESHFNGDMQEVMLFKRKKDCDEIVKNRIRELAHDLLDKYRVSKKFNFLHDV